MDPRVKVLWRKTKKLRIGLVLAGILCLAAFLVLNFSLRDVNGPFEWQERPYKLSVPLDRNALDDLYIQAENVRLEVAMVNNINDIKVSLSGEGYENQDVSVDIRDKTCEIRYASAPKDTPEKLSLRVLIPQNDLMKVQIDGNGTDLHLARMRADQVLIDQPVGDMRAEHVNTHLLRMESLSARSFVENCFVTDFQYLGGEGTLTLYENTFRKAQALTESAPIFVFGDTWRGHWSLASDSGDISTVTRRLPYNLLIQAESLDGKSYVGYDTRYWKDARPLISDSSYYGGVGNNPSNSLTVASKSGDISIDQRARDTDTNPYAS